MGRTFTGIIGLMGFTRATGKIDLHDHLGGIYGDIMVDMSGCSRLTILMYLINLKVMV